MTVGLGLFVGLGFGLFVGLGFGLGGDLGFGLLWLGLLCCMGCRDWAGRGFAVTGLGVGLL